MSAFAGANTNVKSPELVVPEVAVGSTFGVQVAESQAGTPQTIQRVESSLILASGDTKIREAPEVTVSDSHSGLPAFLAASISWSSTASLQAIFIALGLILVTSYTSLCL